MDTAFLIAFFVLGGSAIVSLVLAGIYGVIGAFAIGRTAGFFLLAIVLAALAAIIFFIGAAIEEAVWEDDD